MKKRISLQEILLYYFRGLLILSVNKQGNDVETVSDRCLLYQSSSKAGWTGLCWAGKTAGTKAAVELEPLRHYVLAEDYHQDYQEKIPVATAISMLPILANMRNLQMRTEAVDTKSTIPGDPAQCDRASFPQYYNATKNLCRCDDWGEPLFCWWQVWVWLRLACFSRPIARRCSKYYEDRVMVWSAQPFWNARSGPCLHRRSKQPQAAASTHSCDLFQKKNGSRRYLLQHIIKRPLGLSRRIDKSFR